MNAYTSFEKTVYHYTVLSQYKDTGLDILSDMLRNSVFDKEEAEKEQKVIFKEINMKDDDPDSQIYWSLMETSYKVFPYYIPVIGYEDLFAKLTNKDVADYYETMYSPSNVVVSFVGDFDTQQMKKDVDKYFGPWERKTVGPVSLPEEPVQMAHRYIKKEAAINMPKMMMGYHTVSINHPDLYALDCLSNILGGGKSSRLYKRVIEEEKLAYQIFSSSWTPSYPGLFMLKAVFDKGKYTDLKFAVLDEINKFKYEKVTKEELDEVKNLVKAYSIYSKEDIMSQAESLAESFVNSGSLKFDEKYLEGISNVTPDDIMRVARKYLGYNNLSIVHMVPAEEKLLNTIVKDKEISKKAKVEKIVLENGITLILKEDRKLPMISVNAGFNAGVIVENEENNGISNLLSKMIVTSSKKYSKEKILDIQRKTGSSISASSGNNTIFVSMKCLKENFPLIWDAYIDLIYNNRFEKMDFDKELQIVKATIKQQLEDINYVNSELYRKEMFKGHPYSMDKTGTLESIEKISSTVLEKFRSQVITPSNMTIALTGDFDISKMKKDILNDLKIVSGPEFKLKIAASPEKLKGNSIIVKKMPDKKQSIVRLAFEGADNNNEDRFELSVISNIMSGLGSRLFEELRSKHSLAYSVYGFPFAGKDAGTFVYYIATTPEKRDFAIKMLHEEINKIKKHYVTDDELERAKNKIIGSTAGSMQSTLGVSEDLVLNEMYGHGYDFTEKYIQKIREITKEDVRKIANKYFNDNFKVIVVEP
jgi:zinc protease